MLDKLEWFNPYTYKSNLTFGNYITYQGDTLFTNLSRKDAAFIASALNGAYNNGRFHELLNKEG